MRLKLEGLKREDYERDTTNVRDGRCDAGLSFAGWSGNVEGTCAILCKSATAANGVSASAVSTAWTDRSAVNMLRVGSSFATPGNNWVQN